MKIMITLMAGAFVALPTFAITDEEINNLIEFSIEAGYNGYQNGYTLEETQTVVVTVVSCMPGVAEGGVLFCYAVASSAYEKAWMGYSKAEVRMLVLREIMDLRRALGG